MDEICGSDGKTYYNECYMKKQSCLEKREIRKIHKGTCGNQLLNFTFNKNLQKLFLNRQTHKHERR